MHNLQFHINTHWAGNFVGILGNWFDRSVLLALQLKFPKKDGILIQVDLFDCREFTIISAKSKKVEIFIQVGLPDYRESSTTSLEPYVLERSTDGVAYIGRTV